MKNRIIMNSENLQRTFPEVYKEFFSKCPIVVSAPGTFFWFGEHSLSFGGIGIKQKLPLRVYVGLDPFKGGIQLSSQVEYVPELQKFIKTEFEKAREKRLAILLRPLLKDKIKGFKIHLLSEVPMCRGLNSSASSSSAFAVAVYLYLNQLILEEIKKWALTSTSELISNPALKFDRVFRLALKVVALLHNYCPSGASVFTAFINSSYPIIYFLGKKKKPNPFAFSTNGVLPYCDEVDFLSYYGFRLEEFFDFRTSPTWPIDFGLIYSGEQRFREDVIKSKQLEVEDLGKIILLIKKRFRRLLSSSAELPNFHKLTSKEKIESRGFSDLFLISLEGLKLFEDLFRFGLSKRLEDFLSCLNRYQNVLSSLNLSTPNLDRLCYLLKEKAKERGIEEIGVKLTGIGKGGDTVFALPARRFQAPLDEIIKELKDQLNEDINLNYASWIDGIEEEGIKVEQYLERRIYSPFISPGYISLKIWSKEGVLKEMLSQEEFEASKAKMDLLLDGVEEEIYIKGKKLTSKDIHSASATIKILKVLLENLGKTVSNEKLPESSYSQDRNELQSKIITPLSKAMKKYSGKKLGFSVSGGLVDFFVKLKPDIGIYLIEKIF